MVLGISLSLTLILLLFVVPQFAEMYGENSAELPTINRRIISYVSIPTTSFCCVNDCLHFRYFYVEDGIKTFSLAESKRMH